MGESVSSNKKIKAEYCIPKDRFAEILEHVFERAQVMIRWEKYCRYILLGKPQKPEHKFGFSDQEKDDLVINEEATGLLYREHLIEELLKKEERGRFFSVLLSGVFKAVNKDVCMNREQANCFLQSSLERFSKIKIRADWPRILSEAIPEYVALLNSFRNECRHCLNRDCQLRGEPCPELEKSNEQKEFQS